MHYHNVHHKEIRQEEKVTRLLAQVQDIRDVMGRNLNMILERGAQFDGLLLKTEVVTADAQVFKKKAKIAAEKIERKSYFWTAVLAFIVFVFLYMTVVSMCGVRLNSCRKSSSSSSNGGNGSSGGSSGSSGGNAGG